MRKTVNGTVTDYTLHGKQIVHLTWGGNNLHFFYDAQGKPSIVDWDGTKYGYVYNLQGDVIALVDSGGTQVVEYTYDAWGRALTKTGSLAATLGTLNPFRYRGYVYDEETQLYYLRSRYYFPEFGRFINADSMLGKQGQLLGHNVFSYCNCKPANRYDSNGNESTVINDLWLQPELINSFSDLPLIIQAMNRPPHFCGEYAKLRVDASQGIA